MSTELPILTGAAYTHLPTGRRVVVLDFEYRDRRRPRSQSARTGRYVVRDPAEPGLADFLASARDLGA